MIELTALYFFLAFIFLPIPSAYTFDEVYYVPSALTLLYHPGEPFTYPHPLLGVELISLSIRLFGENPFGWRFLPLIFSTLTLPLFYLFTRHYFTPKTSLLLTTLLAFNPLYFQLTTLSLLEPFYFAFFIASLTTLVRGHSVKTLTLSVVLLALSLSVKITPLPLAYLYFLLTKTRRPTPLLLAVSSGILSFILITTLTELIWANFDPSLFVDPLTRYLAILQVHTADTWVNDPTALPPTFPLLWFFVPYTFKYFSEVTLLLLPLTPILSLTTPFLLTPLAFRNNRHSVYPTLLVLAFWLGSSFLSRPMYHHYALTLLPLLLYALPYTRLSVIYRYPHLLVALTLTLFILQLPIRPFI